MVLINKKINNKYWMLIASVFSCVGIYSTESMIKENKYQALLAFQSKGGSIKDRPLYKPLNTVVINKSELFSLPTNNANPLQSSGMIMFDYAGNSIFMHVDNGIKLLDGKEKTIGIAMIWTIVNPKDGFDKVLIMYFNDERDKVLSEIDLSNTDHQDSRVIFMTGMKDLPIFRPGDANHTISDNCKDSSLLQLIQKIAGDTEYNLQITIGSTRDPDRTFLKYNEKYELELNVIGKQPQTMITPLAMINHASGVKLLLSIYPQDQHDKSYLIILQFQYICDSKITTITTITLDGTHKPDDVCGVFAFIMLYLNNISEDKTPLIVASYLYVLDKFLQNQEKRDNK